MPDQDSHNLPQADMLRYYGQGREAGRLDRGIGILERVRTQEILERLLPEPPATLWDVGGATGVYAFWLAARGYSVHLVDMTPLHIAQARMTEHEHAVAPLASIAVGDACALAAADASADGVLLMGPLYHLTKPADRAAALAEAMRVLKPGGLLVAAAISSYASTMAGFSLAWHGDADYRAMCERELTDGQHRRPETWPRLFAHAFFHTPAALRSELDAVGYVDTDILSVEGFGWLCPDVGLLLSDDYEREGLLAMIRIMERDPVALGLGPHMLAVAHRPGPVMP